jgi:hypothetical protein
MNCSGKSTFIQYMLVRDIASIDDSKIQASVNSVTSQTHTYESPRVVIPNKGHFSATFLDTVGFNALDIDANHVFNELKEHVRFADAIHKILIVHKLGRSRAAVVADTQRTIELLARLGAKSDNVYVTITFGFDYHDGVRERMREEVQELYRHTVRPENVFFSDYVLLSEINPAARAHYEARIRDTHGAIVEKMIVERVEPFKPLVNTFRAMEARAPVPHVQLIQRTVFMLLALLSLMGMAGFHNEGGCMIAFMFVIPAFFSWLAYHC